MTGMTPERLDAIRANLPAPDADLSRRERDALDLLDEVDRLRHENADLRRSRDKRKATERQRRTEDREAWARARDAEMLAEFTEETRTCEDGYAGMSVSYDMTGTTRTTTTFLNKPPTRERRLVSPWKKVVDD